MTLDLKMKNTFSYRVLKNISGAAYIRISAVLQNLSCRI